MHARIRVQGLLAAGGHKIESPAVVVFFRFVVVIPHLHLILGIAIGWIVGLGVNLTGVRTLLATRACDVTAALLIFRALVVGRQHGVGHPMRR